MSTRAHAFLASLVLVLAAGCATGDDGSVEAGDPTTSAVAPATPVDPLAVGRSATWSDATTTLLEVRRPFGRAEQAPRIDGQEWLAVRARTCAGDQPVEVGWYRFSAYGPNAERYPGIRWEHGPWPEEQYPQGELAADTCAAGWMLIPVVVGDPVRSIRYVDPDGLPIAEWTIGEGAA